jgi:hypothetical protein
MNTRRNFFKVLGLAGGVAATGVAGAAAIIASSEKSEEVKKIEANSHNLKFSLYSEYGQIAPPDVNKFTISGAGPNFVTGTRKQVIVSMTVGPDGEMYLKTNGKWRRIVTE